MSWSSPKTWSVSEVLTSSDMNTYVRDNTAELHDPPACRVGNSGNISLANGALQALTFDTERFDTDTMHSTASNSGRITFTTAGLYQVSATAEFAPNATGVRGVGVKLNATTYIMFSQHPTAGVGVSHVEGVSMPYKFAAGDYIEMIAYQNSGGALNVITLSNYSPEFAAVWIGSGT